MEISPAAEQCFLRTLFLHSRAPVPRATTERSRWHLLRSETEGANSCWGEHWPKERPRTVALTEAETMGPNHWPWKGSLSSDILNGKLDRLSSETSF